jgi:hypothetical protein
MIDIQLHFQGSDSKWHKMPYLPRVGDYVTDSGRLWQVDAVIHHPGHGSHSILSKHGQSGRNQQPI